MYGLLYPLYVAHLNNDDTLYNTFKDTINHIEDLNHFNNKSFECLFVTTYLCNTDYELRIYLPKIWKMNEFYFQICYIALLFKQFYCLNLNPLDTLKLIKPQLKLFQEVEDLLNYFLDNPNYLYQEQPYSNNKIFAFWWGACGYFDNELFNLLKNNYQDIIHFHNKYNKTLFDHIITDDLIDKFKKLKLRGGF